MIEETFARIRAHRNNIHRYRQLLSTNLTELERSYIEKRLQQEEAASAALLQTAVPLRPSSLGLPTVAHINAEGRLRDLVASSTANAAPGKW